MSISVYVDSNKYVIKKKVYDSELLHYQKQITCNRQLDPNQLQTVCLINRGFRHSVVMFGIWHFF